MPSEAPESPTNVVDMPVSKDDNGAITTAESPIEEPLKTEETPVNQAPTNTQTQTAQMGGNEPIRTQSFIRGLLEKAKLAIQSRKRNKLDKIMNLFAKQTNITNDEVEKYLHVSDATATRYLSILEKEGKIKQEDISKLSFASEVGEKEKDDTHRGIKLEVVKKIVKETKPTYKETTIPSPEILRQSHDYVRAFALNPNYGKDKIDPRYPKPEYNRPYMFVQLSL